MKNVYFLSDAHLGSLAIPHARMQERRLVRFLDSIKTQGCCHLSAGRHVRLLERIQDM